MYLRSIFSGVFIFAAMGAVYAQDAASLKSIQLAAQAELAAEDAPSSVEEVFTAGALGLQQLNPEISVTGDMLWRYSSDSATQSDFMFRTLGIHFESYLDPYTRFKSAVGVSEGGGAELGEAYMTRYGMLPGVNLTLGKFRQQFGVVNRWHKHGLDQVDFPLALRAIFGAGGLNQSGASVDWVIPDFIPCQQELTLQVTDAQNAAVFAQNAEGNPSLLAHYKAYRDLSESTYVEGGLSVLYGENNAWDTDGDSAVDAEKGLGTCVAGADLTVLWEPADNMRYRNLVWRSELYALNKDLLAPDGSGEDSIQAWGVYSYLESKLSRTVVLGMRGDYFVPDTKGYTVSAGDGLPAQAVTAADPYRWQVGPYLTWNQSPFVHFRVEYDYQDGSGTGAADNTLWLQCIFAAGPHKHERY